MYVRRCFGLEMTWKWHETQKKKVLVEKYYFRPPPTVWFRTTRHPLFYALPFWKSWIHHCYLPWSNMTLVCGCSEVCVRCSGSVARCSKDCGEVQEDCSEVSKHRTLWNKWLAKLRQYFIHFPSRPGPFWLTNLCVCKKLAGQIEKAYLPMPSCSPW